MNICSIHISPSHLPLGESVLLFSSFNVIQAVKNSTGRCEGLLTSMLQANNWQLFTEVEVASSDKLIAAKRRGKYPLLATDTKVRTR